METLDYCPFCGDRWERHTPETKQACQVSASQAGFSIYLTTDDDDDERRAVTTADAFIAAGVVLGALALAGILGAWWGILALAIALVVSGIFQAAAEVEEDG